MYIRLDIWEPLSSLNPGRHLEEDVKLYATIKVLTKSRGIIKKPKTSTVAQYAKINIIMQFRETIYA